MTERDAGVPRFPFAAIVAQEPMKRALLLNAVNPGVGGVLIRGSKGTAKSTAVRSLAALLPSIDVVAGCPFSCDPRLERAGCPHCSGNEVVATTVQRAVRIVDLPVGASEDRLVGSLDIERAIKTAEQAFEPGILAAAHRGVLYIDEVNLLSDHLVDLLLDAAAMGRNYVERDGLSVSHPSRFILVGTMNPEEGELRPQLLDRFGLMVEASNSFTREERIAVVKRRTAFEADPAVFAAEWRLAQDDLRRRLIEAQALLPHVEVPERMLEAIAHVCEQHQVDGLRADIVIHRTASTIAAWEGRAAVNLDDVREASLLALIHRQRRQPFEQPRLDPQSVNESLDEFEGEQRPREEQSPPSPRDASSDDADGGPSPDADTGPDPPSANAGEAPEDRADIGARAPLTSPALRRSDSRPRAASGRRAGTLSDSRSGRHIGARVPDGPAHDLDLPATLRVAAPKQHARGEAGGIVVLPPDLREKVRETRASTLIVFVVDASGSMGAQRRMEATKGAILSLLLDAYQRRDRIAMVSVRGAGAELLLPPTTSAELAHRRLADCPTGGRTPLWAGLDRARTLIETERQRDRNLLSLVVLVSDGRSNVGTDGLDASEATRHAAEALRLTGTRALVVDTESGYVRLGLARGPATTLGADYVALAELGSEGLAASVRERRRPGGGITFRSGNPAIDDGTDDNISAS